MGFIFKMRGGQKSICGGVKQSAPQRKAVVLQRVDSSMGRCKLDLRRKDAVRNRPLCSDPSVATVMSKSLHRTDYIGKIFLRAVDIAGVVHEKVEAGEVCGISRSGHESPAHNSSVASVVLVLVRHYIHQIYACAQ